ncbi:GNAT family N-acetyltransferase [Sphingomonas colocasiae]|uniref:GNAT family N-acetyltransferase n=1 Tax=Sphingomonas colocasiae TaxID=1848973 RepID=A0ABS7PHC6_9SPHN|nr:GNAT family N-acetyltransferase [Sphingomonas colocasiae]MBY8820701.1 GNAT family N-acetyltransferase [Sphingomonas colocasiae]
MTRGAPAGPAPAAMLLAPDALDPALVTSWRDLVRHAAEPNSFLEPWFLLPSLAHLSDGADIRIAVVTTGRMMIALMPVVIAPRYGRMPAPHVENWVHGQSFLGTPLLRAGHETEAAAALIGLFDGHDWARGFVHITHIAEHGPVHRGFVAAAQARGRPCDTVHHRSRALLESDLDADAYIEHAIRGKKRKEFRRLANRLGELGKVETRICGTSDNPAAWAAEFLRLESAGWKGSDGEALANADATRGFFEAVIRGAADARALDMLRLDLDGRAIAMLVNFQATPGSFSYKIAYDEEFSRFSPGVLIELDNIARVLGSDTIGWMDSCAAEGHPMIDRLWTERRSIVRITLPLSGMARRVEFKLCRAAENASATLRTLLADRKGAT